MRKPASSILLPSAFAASGATVAQHSTTPPFVIRARQPLSPSSTCSVCAALMTKTTTASRSAGRASGEATALPPSATKAARVSSRNSQPITSCPFFSRFRAAPIPMLPRPMTPTFIAALHHALPGSMTPGDTI